MSDGPKNGTLQIKEGKARIFLDNEWRDFGPAFVASDIRRTAKPANGRRSAYGAYLLRAATLLEGEGMAAIGRVQAILKSFFGCSEYWMRNNCRVWHDRLQQIWQFRNCTGKKDEPAQKQANKNYRDNFEKIFTLPGDPTGSPQP